jgi:hypothetical protein
MKHPIRTAVILILSALAVASCDKLKPPQKLPLPQMNTSPPAEQAPAPKEQAPGASAVRAAPS